MLQLKAYGEIALIECKHFNFAFNWLALGESRYIEQLESDL